MTTMTLSERWKAAGSPSPQTLADRIGAPPSLVRQVLTGAVVVVPPAFAKQVNKALRRVQALRKARYLVGLVQGTQGLEAQAVGRDALKRMVRRAAVTLLRGPSERLWSA
jgi:hypothetical protein